MTYTYKTNAKGKGQHMKLPKYRELTRKKNIERGAKPPSQKGLKRSLETLLKISESGKGRIPWNKGIKIDKTKYPNYGHTVKHSEQTKKILGVKKKGKPSWNKGISYNPKEKHWNWKGGVSPRVMVTIEYKDWRSSVFKRDDYTCMDCNIRGGDLEAHHIKTWGKSPELRFVLENGITLCKKCHNKTKGKEVLFEKKFNKIIYEQNINMDKI